MSVDNIQLNGSVVANWGIFEGLDLNSCKKRRLNESTRSEATIGSLPKELLREMFLFLKSQDMESVTLVCKEWRRISSQVWERHSEIWADRLETQLGICLFGPKKWKHYFDMECTTKINYELLFNKVSNFWNDTIRPQKDKEGLTVVIQPDEEVSIKTLKDRVRNIDIPLTFKIKFSSSNPSKLEKSLVGDLLSKAVNFSKSSRSERAHSNVITYTNFPHIQNGFCVVPSFESYARSNSRFAMSRGSTNLLSTYWYVPMTHTIMLRILSTIAFPSVKLGEDCLSVGFHGCGMFSVKSGQEENEIVIETTYIDEKNSKDLASPLNMSLGFSLNPVANSDKAGFILSKNLTETSFFS